MNKISAVYKIVNKITGECYIGSSKNVKRRWKEHKRQSTWKQYPNNPLYQDMQKYGLDKFDFQILISIMPECLRAVEQDCIELMKPAYNNINAKGWDVERRKESKRKAKRKYSQSNKGKEAQRKSNRRYFQSVKGKEVNRKAVNKYQNQICSYNGETLTLRALSDRFRRKGIEHPCIEAKKYLL